MSDLALKFGLWPYDHLRALMSGAVKFEGIDATFADASFDNVDLFERMLRHNAYDVSELGLTFYLRTLDLDDPPYIAIPVFPNRRFRHSAIYVNTSSGIEKPQDLVDKTIGEFAIYGHDAGIWPKGILADDYGVTPDQSRWVVGGIDWYMKPFDFIPLPHPENVEVTLTPEGKALGPMLESGEIDALVSVVVPRAFKEGSPNVARLFPDAETLEREYYRRTGIHPIMHTVVIRRDLLTQNPGLAQRIYQGFCASRDVELRKLKHGHEITVPWFDRLHEKNRHLFGDDWWPYGVDSNRKAIDTFLRYSFEQGLSTRRLTCADIFTPELLDT